MSAHSLQQLNEARHEEIRRIQSQLAYLEQEKRTLNERLRMVLADAEQTDTYTTHSIGYYSDQFVLPPRENKAVPIVSPTAKQADLGEDPSTLLLGSKADRGAFLFRLEFTDGERQLNLAIHENDEPEQVAMRLREMVKHKPNEHDYDNWIQSIRKQRQRVLKRRHRAREAQLHASLPEERTQDVLCNHPVPEDEGHADIDVVPQSISSTATEAASQGSVGQRETSSENARQTNSFESLERSSSAARPSTPRLAVPALGHSFDVPGLSSQKKSPDRQDSPRSQNSQDLREVRLQHFSAMTLQNRTESPIMPQAEHQARIARPTGSWQPRFTPRPPSDQTVHQNEQKSRKIPVAKDVSQKVPSQPRNTSSDVEYWRVPEGYPDLRYQQPRNEPGSRHVPASPEIPNEHGHRSLTHESEQSFVLHRRWPWLMQSHDPEKTTAEPAQEQHD